MHDAVVAQQASDQLLRLAQGLATHADFKQVAATLQEGGRAMFGAWGKRYANG